MLGVSAGEHVRLEGEWAVHGQYGRQFKVERYTTVLPATAAGIQKYLGSGLVKGIGPKMAERIVLAFGAETLNVIEDQPERLYNVEGVGPKRVLMIKAAWQEQRQIREVMVFLQSHGVSPALAVRIYKQYGDGAAAVVKTDPYRLARDVYGIGFITADRIARNMGIAADAPERVAAGMAYTLSQKADEGHVYVPQTELTEAGAKLLDVPPALVTQGIETLRQEEQIQVEHSAADPSKNRLAEPRVYLMPFYRAEVNVAGKLRRLMDASQDRLFTFHSFDWPQAFVAVQRQTSLALTPKQQDAVRTALTRRVTVITGGPGTGKTTCQLTLIHLLEAAKRSYVLASPTGRAAKRLSEATGRQAKTVHRLLEFSPSHGFSFQRNEENPLDVDAVIVDEASMLDLLLTNHLLKAIPPGAHLLLVGDIDQLPPVGAGNVLRDVIELGRGRGGAAGCDLPPGRRQLHHRERAPHQPRRHAGVERRTLQGLLPLSNRRPGARVRAGDRDRPGAHPAQVRHPVQRRPGAQPHAPRRGGRSCVERKVAGGAQPAVAPKAGAAPRRPGVSPGRSRDADPQQLRQGCLQR